MHLTTLSSDKCYLLCFWPPWDCRQPKTQLPHWPCALHNDSIINTFFPLLILHFPLQHYFLHLSASCSSFLNLLVCFWHFLPFFPPFWQQCWLWAPSMTFLSLCPLSFSHAAMICDIFLSWQINDSPCASRAVSVPEVNAQCHILSHLFQIPLQNLFPFKTESDITKPE